MSNVERRIYSSYAFEENEREKSKINQEIYQELKEKWRICCGTEQYNHETRKMEPINFEKYDLIYTRKPGHGHAEYTILKNETGLSYDEIALILDGGNLCFGYTRQRDDFFYVFED